MRDFLPTLQRWWRTGHPIGLATVVAAYSSAPLPVGSVMAVGPEGEVIGSVSGGCVEAAVYHECVEAMTTGQARVRSYGISDDDALAAGLTCGGKLEIMITRVDCLSFAGLEAVCAAVDSDRPVACATVVRGGDGETGGVLVLDRSRAWGSTGSARLDDAVADDIRTDLATGSTGVRPYWGDDAAIEVFVQFFTPRPRLVVFGATVFAAALADAGTLMGWRVTVCDARPVFATVARFPAADEVVRAWPHEYLAQEIEAGRIDESTALCVLTHDERFDVELLELALRSGAAGYVGAMGSRRTHDRRMAALRAAGLGDAELGQLRSPIGLDLGGVTPQETAVSILAEIVAARTGASGRPLSATSGTIHASGGKSTSIPVARSPHSTASTARVER